MSVSGPCNSNNLLNYGDRNFSNNRRRPIFRIESEPTVGIMAKIIITVRRRIVSRGVHQSRINYDTRINVWSINSIYTAVELRFSCSGFDVFGRFSQATCRISIGF